MRSLKILNQTENEIWIKGESRVLKFWIHGAGIIPIHNKPLLEEDIKFRDLIKDHLFDNRQERRKRFKNIREIQKS